MDSRIRRWRSREEGAVAVIVALMIVVFIGLAALVIDVGYWYNVRRQLQAAADSGALAGCEQLKLTGSESAAFTEASTYALKNAVAPGDGLEVMPLGATSLSSAVGSDYVKVTVRKPAPTFFCAIFGGADGYIVAQARAELQWVYGMRGLVPLALPVLANPTRVTATINGAEYDLTKGMDGVYRVPGVPVGNAASTTGKMITIKVYNTRNIPTVIDDAARVVVKPVDCPVSDLVVTNCYPVSGDPAGVDISFRSTTDPIEATLGGRKQQGNISWNKDTGLATAHFEAPTTGDLQQPFLLNIRVKKPDGTGNQDYGLSAAATIVARRSTYPIQSVTISQCIVAPDGTVDIALKLHEYEYGERYEMKVVDGMGDTGHYMALDFGRVYHGDLSNLEYDDGSSGASTYSEYLGREYPNVLHIGDIIYTKDGNMPGPTRQGLDARIGSDSCTWAQWTSPTGSHGQACPRLVYVPVMEFYADKTGKRPLIVVNFASFFVESYDKSGSEPIVYGRFIDYVSAGEILGEGKPPVMGVQAPRLVADGLEY